MENRDRFNQSLLSLVKLLLGGSLRELWEMCTRLNGPVEPAEEEEEEEVVLTEHPFRFVSQELTVRE